ncbi:MAG: PaaI family thioesterase [Azospirillaceae bacterium]
MSEGDGSRDENTAIEAEDFLALVRDGLPEARDLPLSLLEWGRGRLVLRLAADERYIRPGGTISGPTLFALCDLALYGAVMSMIGRVELAVTTSMTINFLRRPRPGLLDARCRLMKLGSRLAVGEVHVEDPQSAVVAHATGTYSIPPRD